MNRPWPLLIPLLLTPTVFGACSSPASNAGGGDADSDSDGDGDGDGDSDDDWDSDTAPMPTSPNVIILLADDMGYDDFSARQGSDGVETPHLDRLRDESVSFTQFYTQPVCAPSRAALLTGRDALRTGVWDVHGGRDFLPLTERLLPEYFRDEGYGTMTVGKWHSGFTEQYRPHERGFDEGYMAKLYHHKNNKMIHNGEPESTTGWVSERMVDLAIDYIDDHTDQPFFIYLPFLAPHEPWEAPTELIAKYQDKDLSKALATLYGMIDQMDREVGRVLDHLDDTGLRQNTIVLFMSDNGAWHQSSNGLSLTVADRRQRNPSGLAGNKGEVTEYGVRVPLFVRFSRYFRPREVDAVVQMADIMPTLLDLANIPLAGDNPPLDGRSIRDLLDGDGSWPERPIFTAKHSLRDSTGQLAYGEPIDWSDIRFDDQILAVRNDNYKLIHSYNNHFQLYDMIDDPQEKNSLYNDDELADVVKDLEPTLKSWFDEMISTPEKFDLPVQFVGSTGDDRSVVSARACIIHGEGVGLNSWSVIGLKAVGDSLELPLQVEREGEYALTLAHQPTDDMGASATLTIGDGSTICPFTGPSESPCDPIHISAGATTLRLEITDIGTADGDTVVKNLQDFIFTFVSHSAH